MKAFNKFSREKKIVSLLLFCYFSKNTSHNNSQHNCLDLQNLLLTVEKTNITSYLAKIYKLNFHFLNHYIVYFHHYLQMYLLYVSQFCEAFSTNLL